MEEFKYHVDLDKKGFAKAAYSAYRERAIGLGAMGFHSYLQRNGILFEGMYAPAFNNRAFKHIKERATEASVQFWLDLGVKLLIWLAVVFVTHIFLLLLLMPAAVLYVVERVLALSLRVLTYLRTRL